MNLHDGVVRGNGAGESGVTWHCQEDPCRPAGQPRDMGSVPAAALWGQA